MVAGVARIEATTKATKIKVRGKEVAASTAKDVRCGMDKFLRRSLQPNCSRLRPPRAATALRGTPPAPATALQVMGLSMDR